MRQFRREFHSPAADGGPSRYRSRADPTCSPFSLSVISSCVYLCVIVISCEQRAAHSLCAEEGAAAAVGRLAGAEGPAAAAGPAHQEEPAHHPGRLAGHHRPGRKGRTAEAMYVPTLT